MAWWCASDVCAKGLICNLIPNVWQIEIIECTTKLSKSQWCTGVQFRQHIAFECGKMYSGDIGCAANKCHCKG